MNHTILLILIFMPMISSLAIYSQCGGEGYRGSSYCDWPLQCYRRSRWYSSCQKSCPGGDWECAKTGGSNGGNGAGALAWEQCGGEGWKGPTWCTEYTCKARSVWYSQCRPDCPDGWLCTGRPTPIAPVVSTVGSTQYLSSSPATVFSTSGTPIVTGSTTGAPIVTGSTTGAPVVTGSTTDSSSTTDTTFIMPIITMPTEP